MVFQVNDENNQSGRSFLWKNGGKGYSDGTTQMTLDSSSNLTVSGEVTVNSDERIKDNIEQIDGALEKVQAIRGVTYNRTDIGDPEKRHAGVIAQEVEKVLPEVVTESEETGIKSVAYANMVGLLIEAIKEQQTQIDDLKAEVTRLKGFE
jgi:trimeric autotransporter adhesin